MSLKAWVSHQKHESCFSVWYQTTNNTYDAGLDSLPLMNAKLLCTVNSHLWKHTANRTLWEFPVDKASCQNCVLLSIHAIAIIFSVIFDPQKGKGYLCPVSQQHLIRQTFNYEIPKESVLLFKFLVVWPSAGVTYTLMERLHATQSLYCQGTKMKNHAK